jgi:hypothetical protein
MITNRTGGVTASSVMAFTDCSNNEISLGANTAVLLLEATERRYAAFINNSAVDITLVLGAKDKARINKGIILKPFGGSFEINQNNLYQGAISAIAPQKCNLSYVECIE